jgi:hypothetical protein
MLLVGKISVIEKQFILTAIYEIHQDTFVLGPRISFYTILPIVRRRTIEALTLFLEINKAHCSSEMKCATDAFCSAPQEEMTVQHSLFAADFHLIAITLADLPVKRENKF